MLYAQSMRFVMCVAQHREETHRELRNWLTRFVSVCMQIGSGWVATTAFIYLLDIRSHVEGLAEL